MTKSFAVVLLVLDKKHNFEWFCVFCFKFDQNDDNKIDRKELVDVFSQITVKVH